MLDGSGGRIGSFGCDNQRHVGDGMQASVCIARLTFPELSVSIAKSVDAPVRVI